MGAAIRTILIADLVMSLDNVLAVAAAAKGSIVLLVVGLAVSIPLVVFGSTLLLKLMDRFPIIITLGAALLGWVAGDMATTDPSVKDWVEANAPWLHTAAEVAAGRARGRDRALAVGARDGRPREAPGAHVPVPSATAVPTGFFKRILLPVDASDSAARTLSSTCSPRQPSSGPRDPPDERPARGHRRREPFRLQEAVDDYHRELGEKGIARARAACSTPRARSTGKAHRRHALGGDHAHAASIACDHIVMGTRGLGSYTGARDGIGRPGRRGGEPVPVVVVR
jgi:hypothetical protein